MSYDNKNEIQIESEFNELNISDSNSNVNHENCYKPNDGKLWCKECVPRCIIEGWTSGNNDIDEFIKDTIYDAKIGYDDYDDYDDDNYDDGGDGDDYPIFLEWVPFDKFEDIKQIGEGGFSKVYSAIWIDGKAKYIKQDDGSWKKKEPEPKKIALKKLNESQNISADYLNEIKIFWNFYLNETSDVYLNFYGITKDTKTKEFMMIIELANQGNLRSVLSNDFNNIFWNEKLSILSNMIFDLKSLHKLGYFHKDLHSGNVLQVNEHSYISDFGLSRPSNEPRSYDKIYGVLPYIAPEVLNGEPYTLSSDIYSFGVIMTELSSGKPPFHNRKHDISLELDICNGIRPEFGEGTPEIYKKLAYRCMSAIPNQRPTANELCDIFDFWNYTFEDEYQEEEKFGYKGKEIKTVFEEANEKIPKISTTYEKNPDAIYTSRLFTFNNLPKPINSSIITSYLNEDNKD